jgi:UDP-GlcNAc:undecaprenyl-phosphate GlcNAc-1-phosphate transferase
MLFEKIFLIPAIVAGVIAYAATPLVIKLAWKFGLIDDPRKNPHPKVIHTKPTPRAGGLAIFIAILISSILLLPMDRHLAAILAGASLLTLFGILDDKYNLSPYLRLIIQFAAATLPILAGIGIAFATNPLNGNIIDLSEPRIAFGLFGHMLNISIISDLFAIFWIVTIINFLNMGAKGVDGQLPGVVGIAAVTVAILSYRFSADITEWPVTILAAIVAGGFLGFLPWNAYPQKIMPSFSGSNLGGYFLAVLSILTTTKVGVLAIVLAVPLIDTGYTVARRVMSGKSPVWGDRGHLHHRLLDSGMKKGQVALFYWAVTAILGVLSLTLNSQYKLYTIVGVTLALGGLILWLTYRPRQ